MKIAALIIMLVVAYVVGVLGFTQIIGSIQTRQRNFLVPIVIWVVILAAEVLVVWRFFPGLIYACGIGSAVALLSSLRAGRIE